MSKVVIVKGNNRKNNIKKALKFIEKDINHSIKKKGSDTLFIKINTMDIRIPSTCTNPLAIEAVIEYFYDYFEQIIVGDNSYAFSEYIDNNPYSYLAKKFKKVRLSDLTEFDSKKITFEYIDKHLQILEVRLSLLPKKAFSISLSLPKSHDTCIFSGCSKNMVGCLIKNRWVIHGFGPFGRIFLKNTIKSFKANWRNLVRLIKEIRPDLSIMDAFTGIEGDGPLFGYPIKLGLAMCSLDSLALDMVASRICGFDNVPYLSMCNGTKNIEIIKEGFKDLKKIGKDFKPHYLFKYQVINPKPKCIFPIDFKWILRTLIKRYYRIPLKYIKCLTEYYIKK